MASCAACWGVGVVRAERYRKRPLVVEAVRFPPDATVAQARAVCRWVRDGGGSASVSASGVRIETLAGVVEAVPGDYVIRGVMGEHYPCRPDVFERSYEVADRGLESIADALVRLGGEVRAIAREGGG